MKVNTPCAGAAGRSDSIGRDVENGPAPQLALAKRFRRVFEALPPSSPTDADVEQTAVHERHQLGEIGADSPTVRYELSDFAGPRSHRAATPLARPSSIR